MMRIQNPVSPVWTVLLGSLIGILTFSVGCLIACLYLQRTREADETQTAKATEDSITGIPDIDIPMSIETKQQEPETPAPKRTWHKDGEWSGKGTKTTSALLLDGHGSKVKWTLEGDGYCSASLYRRQGETSRPVQLLVNQKGPGEGETHMHVPIGSYFIEVIALDCKWHIEVFDFR